MSESAFSLLADLETPVGKAAGLAQSLYYLMEPAGPMDADERAAIMWVVSELRHSAADANATLQQQLRHASVCSRLATEQTKAEQIESGNGPAQIAARLKQGLGGAAKGGFSHLDGAVLASLCEVFRNVDGALMAGLGNSFVRGEQEEMLYMMRVPVMEVWEAVIDELKSREMTELALYCILEFSLQHEMESIGEVATSCLDRYKSAEAA